MKFLCVLVCISVASLAFAEESEEGGKIVGGANARIEDYPYQVSLQSGGSHFCGGSYIGKGRVVTAAHCTNGIRASQITVRAGSTTWRSGGVTKTVKSIRQHASYNSRTTDYDVSVLILSSDFPSNYAGIRAITLGSSRLAAGTAVKATGWGTLSEGATASPNILQAVVVPIVATNTCKQSYGSALTDRMICAGYAKGGRDACQGDSGGPLALNKVLYGITSWGEGCAQPNYPGIYTDVTKFVSWINSA